MSLCCQELVFGNPELSLNRRCSPWKQDDPGQAQFPEVPNFPILGPVQIFSVKEFFVIPYREMCKACWDTSQVSIAKMFENLQ